MINITFYKFVELDNLQELRGKILKFCKEIGMKGKILLAGEGITGYCSGDSGAVEKFEEFMQGFSKFSDIWIKKNPTQKLNSKRMLVKIKKEIITFKNGCSMENKGKYLSPDELDELYEKGEDFVIVDVRNNYEHEIGHFKGALKINIEKFSDFPEEVLKYQDEMKGKKIVTYCTGGVRCEKASAWMKENGFENVFQLEGGIVNYGLKSRGNNWDGLCFVFDNRGAIEIKPENQKDWDKKCITCFLPTDSEQGCLKCGARFIQCGKCVKLLEGCCSKFCRNEVRFLGVR